MSAIVAKPHAPATGRLWRVCAMRSNSHVSAPQGVCQACWYTELSDSTPGMTYKHYTDERDEGYRLCPDCAACTVIGPEYQVHPYGRWPVLQIREGDAVSISPRGVRVLDYRGANGEWVILAVTSLGELADLPDLFDESQRHRFGALNLPPNVYRLAGFRWRGGFGVHTARIV